MTPSWSPILKGALAERAATAVTAVAGAIRERPLPAQRSSLAGGEAGIALFYAYLDRVRPGAGHDEAAQEWLDRALDTLASAAQGSGLYGGFTGVAWVAEHLRRLEEDEDPEEDPNEDIDAALLKVLRQSPWRNDFDLTGGLVGYAVYALDWLPRSAAARPASSRAMAIPGSP